MGRVFITVDASAAVLRPYLLLFFFSLRGTLCIPPFCSCIPNFNVLLLTSSFSSFCLGFMVLFWVLGMFCTAFLVALLLICESLDNLEKLRGSGSAWVLIPITRFTLSVSCLMTMLWCFVTNCFLSVRSTAIRQFDLMNSLNVHS